MTVGRYLYFVGRMGLRRTEHDLAVVLASLFWTGREEPESCAIVRSVRLHEEVGIGSQKVWCARAIRALVARGIIEEVAGKQRYRLRSETDWLWPDPLRHAMAAREWAQITGDESVWGSEATLAELVARLLAAKGLVVYPHPWDQDFARWMRAVRALREEVGEIAIDALTEALHDPSVLPPTPMQLQNNRLYLFGLIHRARQRREGARVAS